MSLEQSFNDIGADSIVATDIMGQLGMNDFDLQDPVRFNRFKEVYDYLKNKDYRFTIGKTTKGKQVDKLDHLWGYVELHKQKDILNSKAKKLDEEIGFYE